MVTTVKLLRRNYFRSWYFIYFIIRLSLKKNPTFCQNYDDSEKNLDPPDMINYKISCLSEIRNMAKSIFKKDVYTFSEYFDLIAPAKDIIRELGYSFMIDILDLPIGEITDKKKISDLRLGYYKILRQVSLESEVAGRDFLIAPLLFEVVLFTDSRIDVEYPIYVNEKLNGILDYLIRAANRLIVIEAKKGDLDKGFNQLAAEMIALDQYEEEKTPIIYGAITVGDIWRFAILNHENKSLIRDAHSYSLPEDTEKIFSILIGIIRHENLITQ